MHYQGTWESDKIELRIREDVRRIAERIFKRKRKKLKIEATLELNFLPDFPIIGEYVYGEAFPGEKRVKIDVYAPMTTNRALNETISEELTHIKHPELAHNARFWRLVRQAMKG